ncbi:DUF3955 domain-containing protein [Paenibacillus terrigena]|uniref:DUF3955 domain-containing protein n=1 Tax=Paenibacillus terrigena TaxID=369333 RepID=UPI00037A7B1B|nr:DUF3955 domain-containing protein [Paenibacillus terrigena]
MKRKFVIASTPLLLSVLCFAIYAMIGSSVDSDGTLHEPFFLILIGYLFFFSGIIALLYTGITSTVKKIRQR